MTDANVLFQDYARDDIDGDIVPVRHFIPYHRNGQLLNEVHDKIDKKITFVMNVYAVVVNE